MRQFNLQLHHLKEFKSVTLQKESTGLIKGLKEDRERKRYAVSGKYKQMDVIIYYLQYCISNSSMTQKREKCERVSYPHLPLYIHW